MIALMSWELGLCLLPGLVIGLTIHEFAHAWSASLLGDDFPRRRGRVSLNPLRHLSPLGTLAIFLLPMGWGKPVMLNLHNFRRPKRDYLLTSLAGPAANLLLAAVIAFLMLFTKHTYWLGPTCQPFIALVHYGLKFTAIINIALAMVNLLPIPPLDGSKIWTCLIPGMRPNMGKRVTMACVVIILVLASTGTLGKIIYPAVDLTFMILPDADYSHDAALCRQYEDALADKNYGLAEDYAGELLDVQGPTPSGYYCRAYARGMRENWVGALEDIDAAISLAPDTPESADYYYWRADIHRYLGHLAQATADRRRALELNPFLETEKTESQPGLPLLDLDRP